MLFKAQSWLKNELPFVVYRHPNSTTLNGVFQQDNFVYQCNELNAKGFIFAPFDVTKEKILITGELLKQENPPLNTSTFKTVFKQCAEGEKTHLTILSKALDILRQDKLAKVVLSRRFNANTNKNPIQLIESLLVKYPTAFCYLWYHPKVGTWLGATPEQLLNYKDGFFSTTSLAGTLPVVNNEPPNWTTKELEEQQVVTDYIANTIRDKVQNLAIFGPDSVRAGKLWHLKSEVKGRLLSFNVLKTIVEQLHPTPAVCGLPKENAYNFILEHEGYSRAFYTGFLGPINLEQKEKVNFFVNLRCMQYEEGMVNIFVGGGITALSTPEQEWRETQFKSQTMLDVL